MFSVQNKSEKHTLNSSDKFFLSRTSLLNRNRVRTICVILNFLVATLTKLEQVSHVSSSPHKPHVMTDHYIGQSCSSKVNST